MGAEPPFVIDADAAARDWLDQHHDGPSPIIAYDVQYLRRGVRLRSIEVRERLPRDERRVCIAAAIDNGPRIWVDRRAAKRLPRQFALTVRGRGSRRHLELDLKPEQWGTLLYG